MFRVKRKFEGEGIIPTFNHYLNGQLHREGGPAVEGINNKQDDIWYKHGKLHREDGPAEEYGVSNISWYLEGVKYTEEEYREKSLAAGRKVISNLERWYINGKLEEENGQSFKEYAKEHLSESYW